MADAPRQSGDDDVEGRLREAALANDPVPDGVLDRARNARLLAPPPGSDLLELVHDSGVDERPPVDVDVDLAQDSRLLVFEGSGVRLELRVDSATEQVPRFSAHAPHGRISNARLRTERSGSDLNVDSAGIVHANGERGPFSLLLTIDVDGATHTVHTAWCSL